MVARIQLADNDSLVPVNGAFKNAVAQIRLVKPGVDFVLTRTYFLHGMVDGRIVIPDFLMAAEGHMVDSLGEPVQPHPDTEIPPKPKEKPQTDS